MSLDDPKPQIGELLRLAYGDALQLDPPCALGGEERDATAEQHGSHVQHDLVEQSGPQTLPAQAPTEDPNVPISGCRLGGCYRILDPVRGKADPRVRAVLGWAVGKHENFPLVTPP